MAAPRVLSRARIATECAREAAWEWVHCKLSFLPEDGVTFVTSVGRFIERIKELAQADEAFQASAPSRSFVLDFNMGNSKRELRTLALARARYQRALQWPVATPSERRAALRAVLVRLQELRGELRGGDQTQACARLCYNLRTASRSKRR